jgi:dTDP-4-dehydrorhamnose 3,5-epimerase
MIYNKFDFDKTSGDSNQDMLVPTLIEPRLFRDERGYFFESFNLNDFNRHMGTDIKFVQDNESMSAKGVVRGLHFQKWPCWQSKLVRVVKGAVYDVAVDIRPWSKTLGKHVGVYLSEDNHHQFFIPAGYAHGFIALEDDTIFQYKCDNYYSKEHEGAIKWNDPMIGINWGNYFDLNKVIVSEKDMNNSIDFREIYGQRSNY